MELRRVRRLTIVKSGRAAAGCSALALLTAGCAASASSGQAPSSATASSTTSVGARSLTCTVEATRGAPRLSLQQAQGLVGSDVKACRISEGEPAASALVIPASRTRTDDWAQLISFSSEPVPSGYTESTFTHIYVQVGQQWFMGRALSQGDNA